MKIVGVNIKRAREEIGLTLRGLAEKLGMSASFLSQVENGKASPSLSSLKNISDALNITVSKLIEGGQPVEDSPIVKANERKYLNEAGKGINLYLLTSRDPNKQMEPLLFKLKEGATSGDTSYRHFGQEFVLVLRGAIEITLNETSYILRKGDSIYFNSSVPHSFRNIGKEEAEAVWVVTPPTF
ncbi:MAG: XRE family transcriptional regulator [Candidatus Omnitrophica bacterium]|jgi:transcriptional regulator with XRE-family HTH domain|nr:XRE family transcriptional regulator [Candidatus Omnitrophota bacterium]MDD4013041.1 XRE family transcriptional regulator [Candidatus Omnitrophota bacterium]